jgi:hypothetical protein
VVNRPAGLRSALFTVVPIAAVLSLTGCLGDSSSGPPTTPGKYVVLNQHGSYPYFNTSCLGNPDVPVLENALNSANWNLIEDVHDTVTSGGSCLNDVRITADKFTDSTAHSADLVYFSGHGDRAVIALPGYYGDVSSCQYGCFNGDNAGPNTGGGRMKWLIAYASQSTHVDFNTDTWQDAFNTSGPGLHGYYGVEGEPSDLAGGSVAKVFTDKAIGNGGSGALSIHSAWQAAMDTLGRGRFGAWELQQTQGDHLDAAVSSNGQYTSTNPVIYTNSYGSNQFPIALQSLSTASPGTYSPRLLSTESYNDSSLLSQMQSADGSATGFYASGNQFRIVSQTAQADHYEGSQGLIAAAEVSHQPMNNSQQDALNFAITQAQNYGYPLPSDARLQDISTLYETPLHQAGVATGYEFTWVHSNGTLGGDFIRIAVDNYKQRVCQVVNENDPPYNRPPCLQWGYEYDMRMRLYYRLWRQPANVRHLSDIGGAPPGTDSAALSPSQAYNMLAAATQAKGIDYGNLQGYTYSYWTPSIDSTDNTEYPAYHFFFDSHTVVSVDAYSGQVLGTDSFIQ